eukprot:m.61465 g.61465  ORF g.61465 m.61465 type:complete len:416 (-) comp22986_c0_seq1:264-1511(-)
MEHFSFIVVGNGLMGSAAARYLSEKCDSVAIIGPGEPADHGQHDGVFSSHYDQGRLVRELSRDPIWSVISNRAVHNYAMLEEKSRIKFHGPVGRVLANKFSNEERTHLLEWIADKKKTHGIEYRYFAANDRSWKNEFPFLDFPMGYEVFYDPPSSGYINPRAMLQAQNVIAQQQGAHIFNDLVVNVTSTPSSTIVTTASGKQFSADKVLIACGAFTNFNNLLPEPLPLRLKTESMVWGSVSEGTATALKTMPSVGYYIADPQIRDVYMAPPLPYPDGTFKIKLGCNTKGESWPQTLEEVQAWFQHGPSELDMPPMASALKSVLPDVDFLNFSSHRCIVTYTPSGYPTIDHAPGDEHGRLYVAAGGNGTGAQGSDTLGFLAAEFMMSGGWVDSLPRQPFLATNTWSPATKITKAKL